MSQTSVGSKIVDHSDVVRASPVSAAPTTFSFLNFWPPGFTGLGKDNGKMRNIKVLGFDAPYIKGLMVVIRLVQKSGISYSSGRMEMIKAKGKIEWIKMPSVWLKWGSGYQRSWSPIMGFCDMFLSEFPWAFIQLGLIWWRDSSLSQSIKVSP